MNATQYARRHFNRMPRFIGCPNFPALDDFPKWRSLDIDQGVNMTWHDTPGEQFVSLVMVLDQRLYRNFRNTLISKETPTHASITVIFEFRAASSHVFNDQQLLPFIAQRARSWVCQLEGDELDEVGEIAVR